MNIFTKSLASVGKIFLGVLLVYFTCLLFFQQDIGGIYFGTALLVLVTLPTVFVVYFKKNFTEKHPGFANVWKFLRFLYYLIIVLFVLFMAFVGFVAYQRYKTAQAIGVINSEKITLDDVMGKNLPPAPDQKINDSTLAGIDANKNSIRDDVELAIFKEYPNSAKMRAAELQYAQALQLELTQVFNSETLVVVMQKEDLAFDCLGFSGQDTSLSAANSREKELDNMILNTNLRQNHESSNLKKYMVGYASLPGQECTIDPTTLPN